MTREEYTALMKKYVEFGFRKLRNISYVGKKPHLTSEQARRWENVQQADNIVFNIGTDVRRLDRAALAFMKEKNEQLQKDGKPLLTKEEYVNHFQYMLDDDFLNSDYYKSFRPAYNGPGDDYQDELQIMTALHQDMEKYPLEESGHIHVTNVIKDTFWTSFGKPTVQKFVIENIKNQINRLKEKGVDLTEYLDTSFEQKYIQENNLDTAPLTFAALIASGASGEEEASFYPAKYGVHAAMVLDNIEAKVMEAEREQEEFSGPEVDGEEMGIWFRNNFFPKITPKSMLAMQEDGAEFDKKKPFSAFAFVTGYNPEKVDPDMRKNMDEALLMKAVTLYKENKEDFDSLFTTMYDYRKYGGSVTKDYERLKDLKTKDPGLYKKMNQFRHMIYKIQKMDPANIKLGTDKDPVFVEPMGKDHRLLNSVDRNKEISILNTCYDMLEEPSKRVLISNSEWYYKIMRSIKDLQRGIADNANILDNPPDAYAKDIKKTLSHIKNYYMHKATDGIRRDATLDKLTAVKRVEKFLKSRYKELTGKEYEDEIQQKIPGLFHVEVDKKKSGDDYVLDLVEGEIGNMRRELTKVKYLETDEPQRRMSVSAKHPKAENMLDVEDGEKKDGEEKVKEEGNDLQLK